MPKAKITNRAGVAITIGIKDGRSIDVDPDMSAVYDTSLNPAEMTVKEKGNNTATPGTYRLTKNVDLDVDEREDGGLEFRDAKKTGGIN